MGSRFQGPFNDGLKQSRRHAIHSGRFADVVRGEHEPAALPTVLVEHRADSSVIVAGFLEEEGLEQIKIGAPGIANLPSATTASEVPSDIPLGPDPRATDGIGERSETSAWLQMFESLPVLDHGLLKDIGRRVP